MVKTILKSSWPYLVIGILCLALWNSQQKAASYRKLSGDLEATISNLNQEIEYAELSLNDSISAYQARINNLSFTKDNLEAKYKELLKASRLKPKDVNSVTEIVTVIHTTDTVIAEKDSFGGIQAHLQDAFVSIDVDVKPDLTTTIDYLLTDSITVVNVQKKHSWLFGLIKWKEHRETRVINHNPKADITKLQTIDVIE